MASAVIRLSPVSMTTSTPASVSAVTAAAEVGRGASAMPISAAARPLTATHTTVRAGSRRAGARVAMGAGRPEAVDINTLTG